MRLERAGTQGLQANYNSRLVSFQFEFVIQYHYTMKNSNSFQKQSDKVSQSECQLPRQWDYLSKRLVQVERGLTVLQKKYTKMQKKLNKNAMQSTQLNAQFAQQLLNIKSNLPTKLEIKENISKQIQIIQNQLRNSYSNQISKCMDGLGLNFQDRIQSIQLRVRTVYDQSKAYVDRAVFQLKQLLKKYVKQQSDLQKKIEKSSRENSPSFLPRNALSKSKSAKRLFETSEKSLGEQKFLQTSNNWLDKSRQNISKQSVASANRVSYLRQKLKQFQKVNKKYETETDKGKKEGKDDVMKKMHSYRQYLQQSQSQLQPSNILTSQDVSAFSGGKKNFPVF